MAVFAKYPRSQCSSSSQLTQPKAQSGSFHFASTSNVKMRPCTDSFSHNAGLKRVMCQKRKQSTSIFTNTINSTTTNRLPHLCRMSNSGRNSRLLFSFLLIYIYLFSVPIVSSATSSLTGVNSRRSLGDSSSIAASLSSSPVASPSSGYNTRSQEDAHHESSSGNFISVSEIDSESYSGEMKCLYYNHTQCNQTNTGCGQTFQICRPLDGNDRPSMCYALWQNSTEHGVQIKFKGCWFGASKDCMSRDPHTEPQRDSYDHLKQCVQTRSPNKNLKSLFFCCCSGLMCNQEVKHVPDHFEPQTDLPEHGSFSGGTTSNGYRFPGVTFYLLFVFGIIFLVGVVSAIAYFSGKCRHKPNRGDVPTSEPLLDNCNSSGITGYVGMSPIILKEVRAHGKFGSVWTATDGNGKMVAVKVFSLQDRSSWQIEKDVFSLPQMKHENILTYMGAERYGEGLNLEYWIITEYHPNGSLWDYLKSHTVSWKELLIIIKGISKGLTHLHEELPATSTQGAKPSIAHRDFKSKNVLLSNNFRACIADFGLALMFHSNNTCGDAHGQVGTRRYMAPEVLEGAINFNRDSFLRIDMYACGLVLWELMSRCNDGDIVCGDYRLPFEDEVGLNPSLEDMQEVVAQQKKRPRIPEAMFKHPGLSVVANTVQDCWDQDAEARISASTICERMLSLNEDSRLLINNQSNTVIYRAPFAPNNVVPNANANSKNSFLMTAHTNNGPIPNMNSNSSSNGSAFMLRETST